MVMIMVLLLLLLLIVLLGELNVMDEIVDEGTDQGRQLRVGKCGVEDESRRDFEEEGSFGNAVVGEHGEVGGRVGGVEASHFQGWVEVSVFR